MGMYMAKADIITSSFLSSQARVSRAFLFVASVLMSGISFSATAEVQAEQPVTSDSPQDRKADTQAEDMSGVIDEPHDYLSGKVVYFAREMDRFFGGERNFQEANKSVVQLSVSRSDGQLGNSRNVFAGRAKLDLPTTAKRLHLLIESDPDKNLTGTGMQGQQNGNVTNAPVSASGTKAPESYSAALRYEKQALEEELIKHWSADAGIKFAGLYSRPFARLRGSYSISLEQWLVKPTETIFWFNTTGAGETTQLDIERSYGEDKLFRTSTSATWLVRTLNFDLRQDLSLFHTLDDHNALLYQGSAIGVSRPVSQVTDYVLLVQYRHQFKRKWLYFEISPQLHFPSSMGYHLKTLLTMGLQVNFDETQR